MGGIDLDKVVYMGIVSRNLAHWGMFTATQQATNHIQQTLGMRVMLAPFVGDSLVSRARNEAFAAFLYSKCKYFLFVDDDIAIPVDGITKLVQAEKDIIGGLYRLKREDKVLAARALSPFSVKEKHNSPDQIVEMQYISTGCFMITREMAQTMWDSYQELAYTANEKETDKERVAVFQPYIYNGEYLSEDWAFCQRAIDIGYKIYGHCGVLCSHWGLSEYNFKGISE